MEDKKESLKDKIFAKSINIGITILIAAFVIVGAVQVLRIGWKLIYLLSGVAVEDSWHEGYEQGYEEGYTIGYEDGIEGDYRASYKETYEEETYRVPMASKEEAEALHYTDFLEYVSGSTCFSQIGYDALKEILFVRFKDSGSVYMYENYTRNCYKNFIQAESLGGYYNKYIKGYYPCTRLE